ncbi:MAG: hypothetical protein AAFV72_07605 [Cyanobacteria bacterium J06635_1]
MGNDDVLILTIYALVVFYVLYKMALSYEALQTDQIQFLLDTETLEKAAQSQLARQIQAQSLRAKIEERDLAELLKILAQALGRETPKGKQAPPYFELVVSFPIEKGDADQPLEQLSPPRTIGIAVFPQRKASLEIPIEYLNVEIDNRTPDYQVYIDWDRSSITYFSKQAQRVIRVLPDGDADFYQPQIYSVVNPGQRARINVTTEATFGRNAETQQIERQEPLINVAAIAAEIGREKSAEEKLLSSAFKGEAGSSAGDDDRPIQKTVYSLTLWVSMKPIAVDESQSVQLLLPFQADALLLPGEIAFLPLRILLDWLRNRVENVNTTLTGSRSRR